MSAKAPDKPSLEGIEARWAGRWEEGGVYHFDRTRPRAEVFSIDTPPLTSSGLLHIGHVFSFTHTDLIARYQRMRGRSVFYPMGWDDNGLATERRVENYYGVRCDPTLAPDPSFRPPEAPDPARKVPCSRPDFIALCAKLTELDEQAFEAVWRRLGLSVDWRSPYTTIGERARRASQRAFLRNLARGEAYQAEAPTLWDVTYQTAVAQAELEDREQTSEYVRYGFRVAGRGGDGRKVAVDTTRPELLPACVALVAHPSDARYASLIGSTVVSPLFEVTVPVLAHPAADPEKGTGIAMICTFGDTTDVTWWRELALPIRSILQRDGCLRAEPPPAITSARGRTAYAALAGETIPEARKRVVELLSEAGELDGEPRRITHTVKFYEHGERPLEIVTSRQWYLRNGGRDADLRRALLARGRELRFHPEHMRQRYESWVEGLAGDWLISRQRFNGVPFPLWYPLGGDGVVDWDHPIPAAEGALPVDPSSDVPPGFAADQRGQPGGFVAEPDVMDTWATSSLTPQLACGWEEDPDLFARTFPMDLRPQAHDIIRTWLFSTVTRAHLEFHKLPWSDASISGWGLDPERKKMSKSKGNVLTPMAILEEHGSDAVRYWAASARLGADTTFDAAQTKVGRRLAIKLLNASKFCLGAGALTRGTRRTRGAITAALDRALMGGLVELVSACTTAFEGYDHARALERTESFFWAFCDDHLELVKGRTYGARGPEGAASAQAALGVALSVLQRLFAPFLPFVTEEVWSWWQTGSVHRAPWPTAEEIRAVCGGAEPGPTLPAEVVARVLGAVRRAKTEARVSMKAPVARVVFRGPPASLEALSAARDDIVDAGVIGALELEPASAEEIQVWLAEPY